MNRNDDGVVFRTLGLMHRKGIGKFKVINVGTGIVDQLAVKVDKQHILLAVVTHGAVPPADNLAHVPVKNLLIIVITGLNNANNKKGAELADDCSYSVGIVNNRESFLYKDNKWFDWKDVMAEEVSFAIEKGKNPDNLSIDNFSIKAYLLDKNNVTME